MSIQLKGLLPLLLLATGCHQERSDEPGAVVLEPAPVTSAYFGLDVWLGSHAEQLARVPAVYDFRIVRFEGAVDCADVGAMVRDRVVPMRRLVTRWEGALEPGASAVSAQSSAAGAALWDWEDVDGRLVLDAATVRNLPDPDPWRFYESAINPIEGELVSTFISARDDLVWAQVPRLPATHCPALDVVSQE